MSKREHNKEQSYIDWLKSLGCVLWFPFAYDGDLNDRISGNNLQPTSDTTGYFAWDANKQMMYYHSSNSSYVINYTLNTEWDNSTFPTNRTTTLSECQRKSLSGGTLLFFVGSGFSIVNIGAYLNVNGTAYMQNWDNNLHKEAYYVGPDYRKVWQDGNFFNTYAAITSILPSNWGSFEYKVGNDNTSRNVEVYLRNIMIFNRELTQQEIKEVQGI